MLGTFFMFLLTLSTLFLMVGASVSAFNLMDVFMDVFFFDRFQARYRRNLIRAFLSTLFLSFLFAISGSLFLWLASRL